MIGLRESWYVLCISGGADVGRLFWPNQEFRMKLVLQRIFDGFERADIVVSSSQFLIGSGKDCQLRPHGLLVAERHCEISLRDYSAWVKQIDCRYGTLVNGQPIEGSRRLRTGDVLMVGIAAYRVFFAQEATYFRFERCDSNHSVGAATLGFAG